MKLSQLWSWIQIINNNWSIYTKNWEGFCQSKLKREKKKQLARCSIPLERFINSYWHNSPTVPAQCFINCWYNSSIVTGTIVQSLKMMCNSRWQDCSTVASTILQQLLTRLFNSGWHDSSTVTGIILQQSLARLLNSYCHDSSTVDDTILQQPLA